MIHTRQETSVLEYDATIIQSKAKFKLVCAIVFAIILFTIFGTTTALFNTTHYIRKHIMNM